ncbi:conserved hypothetical protein [Methanothermus fervidus DSM 2088]|uniref:Uncharacterized protein n=1 Tax=Methanothermus fervidus (strain ATCC 43054 / DSM 2088 / JCM 10308 / V24 S) TaxID=523846 RepID=E3GW25_METFV|nr:hypothetical protein [Methanothermus fervidus]ADP77790.1 conserved hypothetical protein [Methanothermus fervidus DSM 2088]
MEGKNQKHGVKTGLLFVACMFIGVGIGLAFHRPDVGSSIGMGIGFLLMAIFRSENKNLRPILLPRSTIQIILFAVGILFAVSGLCLLFNPELIYPYVLGIGAIIIGILILIAAITLKK